MIGRIGDDAWGERIATDLERWGVDTSALRRVPGRLSPLSAVSVDRAGERNVVNYTDPNLFTLDHPLQPEEIANADAVLCDIRWPTGAETALRAAAAAGIPGILDFDSHELRDLDELLQSASHVIFSAPALSSLAATDDMGEGLKHVRGRTDAWLAVTMGPDGVCWLRGPDVGHLPAFPVEAVDTLGAGDVFHGAFALAVADGKGEEEALRLASAAAAIKCTRFGGREGTPSLAEVQAFLEQSS